MGSTTNLGNVTHTLPILTAHKSHEAHLCPCVYRVHKPLQQVTSPISASCRGETHTEVKVNKRSQRNSFQVTLEWCPVKRPRSTKHSGACKKVAKYVEVVDVTKPQSNLLGVWGFAQGHLSGSEEGEALSLQIGQEMEYEHVTSLILYLYLNIFTGFISVIPYAMVFVKYCQILTVINKWQRFQYTTTHSIAVCYTCIKMNLPEQGNRSHVKTRWSWSLFCAEEFI